MARLVLAAAFSRAASRRIFGCHLRATATDTSPYAAAARVSEVLFRIANSADLTGLSLEVDLAGVELVTWPPKTQAAKVTITRVDATPDGLAIDVQVENLSGHKLPTAYPSRRAWLHFAVRDGNGRVVFESGALNPDGSIVGNDNDEDPLLRQVVCLKG